MVFCLSTCLSGCVDLFDVIVVRPLLVGDDSWFQKLSLIRVCSVQSTYESLSEEVLGEGYKVTDLSHLLAWVQKSWAPSKVQVFFRKLLLYKIPTIPNLLRYVVISDPGGYVCAIFGVLPSEWTISVSCVGWPLRRGIRFLGGRLDFFLPRELDCFILGLAGRYQIWLGFFMIQHTLVWSIQITVNDLVFYGLDSRCG